MTATIHLVRFVLNYNPETGIFTWLAHRGGKIRAGDKAGSKSHDGYWRILLDRKQYMAHRLAWFWMTGEWPKEQIDHINGIKDDNRWCNLREATISQNNRNKKVNGKNTTGIKGVSAGRDGKFRVYLCLGTYDTKEEAKRVYDEAASKLHGEFFKS